MRSVPQYLSAVKDGDNNDNASPRPVHQPVQSYRERIHPPSLGESEMQRVLDEGGRYLDFVRQNVERFEDGGGGGGYVDIVARGRRRSEFVLALSTRSATFDVVVAQQRIYQRHARSFTKTSCRTLALSGNGENGARDCDERKDRIRYGAFCFIQE